MSVPDPQPEDLSRTLNYEGVLPVPAKPPAVAPGTFEESLVDVPIPVPQGLPGGEWGWAASGRESEEEWNTLTSRLASIPASWSQEIPDAPAVEPVDDGQSDLGAPGDLDLSQTSHAEDGLVMGDMLTRTPIARTYEGTLGVRPVHVRVLSSAFAKMPRVLEGVRRGAEAASGLDNDHVHAPLVVGTSASGRPAVIYPVLEAPSLRELLSEGPLGPPQALLLLAHVGAALVAAHERGLAHGDLRPETIHMSPGHASVTDYGFAQAVCLRGRYDRFGLTFGHPDYLAPEVVQEGLGAPSFAADVYALGMVVYEVLTGELPFPVSATREALVWHLRGRLPRLPETVPRPLATLLASLVAKTPEHRPRPDELLAQVAECRKEIALERRRVFAESGVDLPMSGGLRELVEAASRPAPAPPPAARVNRVQLMASALGVIGCLLVVVVLAAGGSDPEPTTETPQTVETAAERTAAARKAWEEREQARREKRRAAEEALHAEVDAYEREVRAELAAGKLDGAPARPVPARLRTPATAERLRALEQDVRDARSARDADRLAQLKRLVAAGDMHRAARLAPTGEASESRAQVEAWSRARAAELHALRSMRPVHPKRVGDVLRARFNGWSSGGTLYPGGGTSLRYESGARLHPDLEAQGAKARLTLEPGAQGGVVLSGRGQALFLHRLPLQRPLTVMAEVEILDGNPVVSVVCGLSAADGTGLGSAWGKAPVRLKDHAVTRKPKVDDPPARGRSVRLELVVRSVSKQRWRVSGAVRDLGSGAAESSTAGAVRERDLAGQVGLQLLGTGRVRLTAFEVRGLLDPRPLLDQ